MKLKFYALMFLATSILGMNPVEEQGSKMFLDYNATYWGGVVEMLNSGPASEQIKFKVKKLSNSRCSRSLTIYRAVVDTYKNCDGDPIEYLRDGDRVFGPAEVKSGHIITIPK